MAEAISPLDNEFVVAILHDLRAANYTPRAWIRFFGDSWMQMRATARAHPSLRVAWARGTLLVAGLALLIAVLLAYLGALAPRFIVAFAVLLALQQTYVYIHMGLARQVPSGRLMPRLGVPTMLTLVRGLLAATLLALAMVSTVPPRGAALGLFLAGIATDIADGQIARRTGWRTKLGQILDGEADLCLYAGITAVLIRSGALPLWLGFLLVARFLLPVLAAIVSYFVFARTVAFGSTIWGKAAGMTLTALIICALIRTPTATGTSPLALNAIAAMAYLPLLVITAMLLVSAPASQLIAQRERQNLLNR
jgi:phosphatidylglycerophosphate synthase